MAPRTTTTTTELRYRYSTTNAVLTSHKTYCPSHQQKVVLPSH